MISQTSFDFDFKLQKLFNKTFAGLPGTDWESWLKINSAEEYEELAIENSGLPSESLESEHKGKTDPELISLDNESVVRATNEDPIYLCHTSGTSGGDIKSLKRYHISRELAKGLWAPGMRAIFDSSGLEKTSSAVIYVPSRLNGDGLSTAIDGRTLINLYSSEFSQRLVLSLINPRNYVLDVYKSSRSLFSIAKILSLEEVSVISAPSATVLGWSDIDRLQRGIERSLHMVKDENDSLMFASLKRLVKNNGARKAAIEIQKKLSNKLSNSTLIFSTTSLTEVEWSKIRGFFNWRKGEERFTNLYVGSEIGPFAASIDGDKEGAMRVFPLTLPSIERKGRVELISRTKNVLGRLLVSRMDKKPLFNIDTGDLIRLESQDGLPMISGDVMRTAFKLENKNPPHGFPGKTSVYAGHYFDFGDFEIVNPHELMACVSSKLNQTFDSGSPFLLVEGNPNQLKLPLNTGGSELLDRAKEALAVCPGANNLGASIQDGKLQVKQGDTSIGTVVPRKELLQNVGKGLLPKGVLKKWPIYIIRSK